MGKKDEIKWSLKSTLIALIPLFLQPIFKETTTKKKTKIIINNHKLNMLTEEILSKHYLMMMNYKQYALSSWSKNEQNK